MIEEQSTRPVSLASTPKFIVVGYALLNNKILVRSGPVWSVPGFNEGPYKCIVLHDLLQYLVILL